MYERPVEKRCDNCEWFHEEGGDLVPYGSTTARLPDEVFCEHECLDEMSDEEVEAWFEEYVYENKPCEHWQFSDREEDIY